MDFSIDLEFLAVVCRRAVTSSSTFSSVIAGLCLLARNPGHQNVCLSLHCLADECVVYFTKIYLGCSDAIWVTDSEDDEKVGKA